MQFCYQHVLLSNKLWQKCFCLCQHHFTCRWSVTLTSDPLNEAAGLAGAVVMGAWGVREMATDVHLTADVATCHSSSFLKGTWAKLRSGATDEQPGGSAFRPQWHLQYGQSAAQQAHQSKSALSSRCVWSQRSITKPANSVSY